MKRQLKTKRVITLKIYKDATKTQYLKVRDVAAVLCIKQPFEFTHDLTMRLGPDAVKHGIQLKELTPVDDTPRAVYISIVDLYRFLNCGTEWKCKMNLTKKRELVSELKEMVQELNL